MPLELFPCTLEDIPTITEIFMIAFADGIARYCFPRNEPSVWQWWTDMHTDEFKTQHSAHFLKIVDSDDDARMVAFAKWNIPIKDEKGEYTPLGADQSDMPKWAEGSPAEVCDEVFGTMAARRGKIMGTRPYFYLEMIGTLPAYRGQGAASKLINWGLKQADEAGLEAYLEGNPEARPIYERYGWKAVDEVYFKSIDHAEAFMLRPAKPGSHS